MSEPSAWSVLAQAGLLARAIRVQRREVAYFKYLFESHEGTAIVRTVRTLPGGEVVIAILAPDSMVGEAQAILVAEESGGKSHWVDEPLPPECREDWFLAVWAR